MAKTKQTEAWTGDFGREYLARNGTVDEADLAVRAGCLKQVLDACPTAPASILEVGSNVGLNLHAFARLSAADLHAVEPFREAFDRLTGAEGPTLASAHCTDGSALPHADGSIDMVFTSGVLIHVHPDTLESVMDEVHRVAGRYVWVNEYFGKKPEELPYRGATGLLWKRDFGGAYLDRFPDLKPIATGFFWARTTPYDDTTWWLFEKRA